MTPLDALLSALSHPIRRDALRVLAGIVKAVLVAEGGRAEAAPRERAA